MGIFNRFFDQIRPNDDDDEYLDDDYFDDDEDDVDRGRRRPASRPSQIGGIFQRKVIDGAPQGLTVVTIKPSGMDESRDICDALLDGKAVVLNMEGISTDIAQRIIDFTLGAIYAIDGDLQMVSKFIFIASPQNVELSGDYQGDFVKGSAAAPLSRQQTSQTGGFTFNV